MKWPSFTLIISGLFLAYIGHSMWNIYQLFFPKPCPPDKLCLKPYMANRPRPKYEIHLFTSKKPKVVAHLDQDLLWRKTDLDMSAVFEETVNVSVPQSTRNNGSFYLHAYLVPVNESPFSNSWTYYATSSLTKYSLPQSQTFNLMGDNKEETDKKKRDASPNKKIPISHWRSKLQLSIMDEEIPFERQNIPGEIYRHLQVSPENEYLPILYIDELASRIRDLMPLNKTSKKMPLTIKYQPISVGKLRMWVNMQESFKMLHGLGFTDKDTDEVKGIFADTNFYFLMLTFTVAAFHLLFDFLAFKNDVTYWKNRDSMVGLSSRTVLWRCFSTIIIFLYLMDEETSLLVLIPAGIGTIIEIWKVKKAFKITLNWSGLKPSLQFGTESDKEKETSQFDHQAMKYLSYLLYPLCIAGAVYSLVYVPHKSCYSWCIQSLVNGVYAFGFLFMLPQLFVNYKLKSVAHLPWRAFMYKAFNTFIDDIFAFIITMPTAHRLACFRDDVVFLAYLYQRWLYPVDKTRVNEYGQSFDEKEPTKETKKTK